MAFDWRLECAFWEAKATLILSGEAAMLSWHRIHRVVLLLCITVSLCYSFISTSSSKHGIQHSNAVTRLNLLVPVKQITDNRKSGFEYEFTETYIAGLMLTGTEVKSCRKGMVQLSDSMAEIIDGECWLLNCHIGELYSTILFLLWESVCSLQITDKKVPLLSCQDKWWFTWFY